MPDIIDRSEKEAQYARLMAKLLKAYGGRLLEKLGDPPDLKNLPADFWDDEANRLVEVLSPFGKRVYLDAARELMKQTRIEVDWNVINENAAKWSRQHTGGWLARKINDTTRDTIELEIRRLKESIPAYFERQMTIGDLEQRLQENGLFGPVRAEMIAVTEVTRAASEGEQEMARELAAAGIEMVPVWQTNNDELVCEICEPKNERPIKDAEYPPAHPRCRCWVNYEFPRAE